MLRKRLGGWFFATIFAFLPVFGNAAENGYAPQINNERGIKVTATLQDDFKVQKTWGIEVTLETHTRDLSDDLVQSSALIADGKRYLPLSWDGAPPGGHHRKGLLCFKAVALETRSIELQVRLSGDASPRSFRWLLK